MKVFLVVRIVEYALPVLETEAQNEAEALALAENTDDSEWEFLAETYDIDVIDEA